MTEDDDHGGGYIGRLRKLIGPQLLHVPGTVVILENEKGEILLHKRSDNGLWCLPGGAPEDGETTIEQAVRETREETGLTPHNLKPFGFASEPAYQTLTYPNGDVCHYRDLLLWSNEYEGEFQLSDETTDVAWFAVDQLPDLMEASAVHVKALLAFKKTGEFQIL